MHVFCENGIRRTVLLHDVQETDDDLGGRADQDLALAGLLGVVDGVKRIVENGGLHVGGVVRRFLGGEAAKGICSRDVLAFKSLPERKECPSGSHNGWRTEGSSARPSWAQRCHDARSEWTMSATPWLPEGHLLVRQRVRHTS
jgi:hypothetical protein